jgi:predicted Rossmann fold nucleotide-binding protein DprA/Smf involved in DNA uptake
MGKPPVSNSVALIGTRDLSAMGYYFIQEILDRIKLEGKNIYAGFAAGVEKVATEGAIKNGSYTTAVLTHALNKPVFTVKDPHQSIKCSGNNALIKNKVQFPSMLDSSCLEGNTLAYRSLNSKERSPLFSVYPHAQLDIS